MKFSTVVVDPPWDYNDRGFSRRNAESRYRCLSLAEIAAVPIEAWASVHSHLYLWTTNAFMEHAFSLARLWGFRPKTVITWVKPQLGTGHYYRNTTEHAIFATRGSLDVLRHNARTDFTAPRARHSAKPDAFYELVESMSPPARLDVFARRTRAGWSVFGDEVEGSIPLPIAYRPHLPQIAPFTSPRRLVRA
jgi:N6-adenosine-specific RNA methylase IME4